MLGWDIYVYRKAEGGVLPATEESAHGSMLAEWSADVDGLDLHVFEAPQDAAPTVEYGERAFIAEATVAGGAPDEWLGVEAWDQS
jgi:hypothetical protein